MQIPTIQKVNQRKLISIVIPSYCRSQKKIEYLDYALKMLDKNISKLNNFDYEIILFDNFSIRKLDFFIQKYPNLNLIYKYSENLLEPHDSWRKAASYSVGKYIYFHSDDDFIYGNFFVEFYNLIESGKFPKFFYWKSKNVNDEDYSKAHLLWYWNWPRRDSGYFKIKTGFIKHPMPSSSWILERKFYENHGVTPSIAEGIDLDLSFRITKYIDKGYFLSNTYSAYRHHSDQGTKIDDPQLIDSYKWFINKGAITYRYFHGLKGFYYSYLYILYYGFLHALKGKLVEDLHNQENETKKEILEFLFGSFVSKNLSSICKNYFYFLDKEIFFMFFDTLNARPDYLLNKLKKIFKQLRSYE